MVGLDFGQADRDGVLSGTIVNPTLNKTHEPEGLRVHGIGSGHVYLPQVFNTLIIDTKEPERLRQLHRKGVIAETYRDDL
ncbi:hypothetical protein EMIT0P4_480006 [Pseudomonas sp. IT-P4]